MKSLLICIALLFYSSIAFSTDIHPTWDPADRAAAYKLETLVNLEGITWSAPIDVGITLEQTVTFPDDTLILIKNKVYDTFGDAVRSDAGVWFKSDWSVIAIPNGIGID